MYESLFLSESKYANIFEFCRLIVELWPGQLTSSFDKYILEIYCAVDKHWDYNNFL